MTACVIPGCAGLVEHIGETCAECVQLFGDMLRPTDRPPLTAEQIHDRDAYVARAYYAQRSMQ